MSFHALKGAAVGAAGGLAVLALGIPVLAPVALIAGLVAGICKDNEEVRQARRRAIQEREASDSDDDQNVANRYLPLNSQSAMVNYNRHHLIDPDIDSILQRLNEQPRLINNQRRIATRDFNFAPFRTENEDEDMPRFVNNNHEERRPRRDADNTQEPSLRNEEYFRRHDG